MPIWHILRNDHSFTPEDNTVLVAVFEETLKVLNLSSREDPVTKLIAERIVELAKKGERDPVRLRSAAMASLGVGRG
jgi:hypothetical protein